jgi:Domain of unknown function (DUF4082)
MAATTTLRVRTRARERRAILATLRRMWAAPPPAATSGRFLVTAHGLVQVPARPGLAAPQEGHLPPAFAAWVATGDEARARARQQQAEHDWATRNRDDLDRLEHPATLALFYGSPATRRAYIREVLSPSYWTFEPVHHPLYYRKAVPPNPPVPDGWGLLRSGETTLSFREYHRLNARGKLPAEFRVKPIAEFYAHGRCACTNPYWTLAGTQRGYEFGDHVVYFCPWCGQGHVSGPIPQGGAPNTFHVATTGSDSNNGSSLAQAFRTVNRGAQAMVANNGDTVLVHTGTYFEVVNSVVPGAPSFALPSTLGRFQNELVTLSAAANTLNHERAGHYVIFDGLAVTSQGVKTSVQPVQVSHTHHVRHIRVHAYGSRYNACITIYSDGNAPGGDVTPAPDGSHFCEQIACECNDVYDDWSGPPAHGVYISSTSDTLTDGVYVHDYPGVGGANPDSTYGWQCWSSTKDVGRNTLRNFRAGDGFGGGSLFGGHDMYSENVIIWNQARRGAVDQNYGVGPNFNQRNKWYHWTVVNTRTAWFIGRSGPNCEIRNALLSNVPGVVGLIDSGQPPIQSNVLNTGTPGFVNASGAGAFPGAGFQLLSTSPARDAGANVGVATDLLGLGRDTISPDLGAFEFAGAPLVRIGDPGVNTIWADTTVPLLGFFPDDPVELGVRFRCPLPGYAVVGIRFYKFANNAGPHTGKLYSNTGTLLGSVTFAGETASGWQTQLLAPAVPLIAGRTYVAAYISPGGGYAYTENYFTSDFVASKLLALQNGLDGANGCYLYGGGFPTSPAANSRNYWVDVLIAPVDRGQPGVLTIWDPATSTPTAFGGADQAFELGTRFRSTIDGHITKIRFYKHPSNLGTHVGKLYSLAGALLGSVTFTGETASGWQSMALPSPILVTAGLTYVASVTHPVGFYPYDQAYYTDQGFAGGHLLALQDGVDGPNGCYAVGTGFPTLGVGEGANYWTDVELAIVGSTARGFNGVNQAEQSAAGIDLSATNKITISLWIRRDP